jgi:hypothetical protein
LRESTNKALESGEAISPQEFMLSVLNNRELDLQTRLDAAAKVAPYVHPKLIAQDNLNQDAGDQYFISDEPMSPEQWEAEFCQPTIEGRGQPLGVTINHVDALRMEVLEAENTALKEELARLKRAAELPRELTPQEIQRRLPALS